MRSWISQFSNRDEQQDTSSRDVHEAASSGIHATAAPYDNRGINSNDTDNVGGGSSRGNSSRGANVNMTRAAVPQGTVDRADSGKFRLEQSPDSRRLMTGNSQNALHGHPSQRQRREHMFGEFMGAISSVGGTFYQDAEMERRVTKAAKSLGEEVQNIVKAAQGRSQNQDEWKIRLLDLLGSEGVEGSSYVDVLLANSPCTKFVQKCVENELPPNLIHCLRLLRVLELQHSHVSAGSDSSAISTVATSKVSQLLTLLCTDPMVGEQLRPHLFGLLALSGASYPRGGVHIASAASSVVLAFADSCLSSSLVWFLHEKKMIVHMTDDIKELCGMTAVSSASVTTCLYGADAEQAGLWVVALRTVITLVTKSALHRCFELLSDFDEAGGYHVMGHAISHSTQQHVSKLLELLVQLVCCNTTAEKTSTKEKTDDETERSDKESSRNLTDSKLASNVNALETIADLMARCVPFLASYVEAHKGKRPVLTKESVKELAKYSVECAESALKSDKAKGSRVDLSSELLVITLQLYSDHSRNYSIIESRYNILSLYLLAFPTITDVSTKVLVLKTLEYVCTGLMGSDSLTPLRVGNEILFAMFCHLFELASSGKAERKSRLVEGLLLDAEMLCGTMEKLIEFDKSMSGVISGCGLLDERLSGFLVHAVEISEKCHGRDTGTQPASSTSIDKSYSAVCRFLRLMVRHNQSSAVSEIFSRLKLSLFLSNAVTQLGDDACRSALSVYEAVLSVSRETIKDELACVMDLLLTFADAERPNIIRMAEVFQMLKAVLETNEYSHEAFRTSKGYEVVIRLLFELEKMLAENGGEEGHIMLLYETIFAVIAASSTPPSGEKQTNSVILVKASKDHSGRAFIPAWMANRRFLMRSRFFIAFASATASTGVLRSTDRAEKVLNLSLALLDPSLPIIKETMDAKIMAGYLPNADATRLVLGVALHLPPTLVDIGKRALDEILRLCAPDKSGSTLSLMSSSGIISSLTSPREFGPQLEDRSHPLYSRCMLLLRRIAAFSMSYSDYVSLLRFMAGPLLKESDTSSNQVIKLPVISSSLHVPLGGGGSSELQLSPDRRAREADFCTRLETLSIIAERGDRVVRCLVGGDSLNTIALYMQNVPVEERLYRLAEEGRIKFIEVPKVDSAASFGSEETNAQPSSTSVPAEKIWGPFSSSGFSFSLWFRLPESAAESIAGSLFLLDISCNSGVFLSLWYDVQHQQVCVLSSASSRNEPNRFPATPLTPGVWHHLLFTYQLPKRSVMMRKAIIYMYVNGRLVEGDVKVDNVNVLPTARVHIGAPCPKLAASGVVRGSLPLWELGPCLMIAAVLSNKDATAIFAAGPEYEGLFWGDRPQRLSFTASSTAAFAMLADSGEDGSMTCALRRRNVPEVEAAGHVMRERGSHDDSLATVGLLCSVDPEDMVFGLHASAFAFNAKGASTPKRGQVRTKLINVARQNAFENVSSDAYIYGSNSIVCPHSFGDNLQWVGGPNVLLPLVNSTQTAASLSLALRLIRAAVDRHAPNLECLQAGGGYRILGLLLRQKRIMNTAVLDQCFAFAVHGFIPGCTDRADPGRAGEPANITALSETWVFTDLDAMKYLLLNHQIWDLRRCGPELPMRLLSFLNGLVSVHNVHAGFNASRLHLLGIVTWVLHLMLEAAVLYSADDSVENGATDEAPGSRWSVTAPSVATTAVGGDPDNSLLLGCKTLLRRVLTFMLTPGDLNAAAGAAIFTLSISEGAGVDGRNIADKLLPGPVARVYILRLLEELVVDGVNEIVMANRGSDKANDDDESSHPNIQPHAGGGTSMNQSYLTSTLLARKKKRGQPQSPNEQSIQQQSHNQAQAFLAAFSEILTPNWFACILEGCREEASASAAFRLMILLLQSSPTFSQAFEEAGGFAPLVLSIPKFSTCPSIIMSMLSQLLHAPILHLPCFATLDAAQLCEVFDAESDSIDLCIPDSTQGGLHSPSDPSCGIFALLAECLGRNIQLAALPGEVGLTARKTNEAVLRLLGHRHTFSSSFQEFCRTRDFLEPLAQALCLVHEEKMQQRILQNQNRGVDSRGGDNRHDRNRMLSDDSGFAQEDAFMAWPSDSSGRPTQTDQILVSSNRRGSLSEVDLDKTPTERFVSNNFESEGSGIGMVQLLQLIVSHAVLSGPLAASLISALFHSFPIHATPDQVEVFHLLLIEHCKDVVEDALQRGEPFALANCVGVSSVFLDRLMAGFFTSEPILETVNMVLGTLQCLTGTGSYASRTLGVTDQNMLIADCAHLARLTCLTALQRSRPRGHDQGDDDLKLAVLGAIGETLADLLLAPSVGPANQKPLSLLGGSVPLSLYNAPAVGTKSYSLWQSGSLTRCPATPVLCSYPDLKQAEQPDRAFVISVMAELHICLLDRRRTDIRQQAAFLVVCLIQQCPSFMSELLIKDISQGDTVDLMNRGGFGALVAEYSRNALAGNAGDASSRKFSGKTKGVGGGRSRVANLHYGKFFDWLERNQVQVEAVFHNIHLLASRLLTGAEVSPCTPEEAIEKEQKVMLLKLTSQDSSDRTILGGLERAELAQLIHEQMAESHTLWKRQGFDDIASGTTQWKVLLRQLKGPLSIWEGTSGGRASAVPQYSKERLLILRCSKNGQVTEDSKHDGTDEQKDICSTTDPTRWKLDLTEGYERQRRRLLPNHEFYGLYNLDDGTESSHCLVAGGAEDNIDEEESTNAGVKGINFTSLLGNERSMDATTALLKEMHITSKNIYEEEEDERQFEDDTVIDAAGEKPSGGNPADAGLVAGGRNAISDSANGENTPQMNNHDHSRNEGNANVENRAEQKVEDEEEKNAGRRDGSSASSYDLITGLLEPGDWPEKSYNVKRCTGLEVKKALLLWCSEAIYIVDGFEQTEGEGLEGKITRLEMSTSTFNVNIRKSSTTTSEANANDRASTHGKTDTVSSKGKKAGKEDSSGTPLSEGEITYQHRSQRIAFNDLFSVYKRRYQLQPIALEFYDVHRNGILVAFQSGADREEILSKVLSSPLPNSIFASSSLGGGSAINYDRFMASLRAKITSQWVNGRMSNFEFIMHLNSFAGRTYNDLTQYPVFPWILSDYESESIDLTDPSVYRDLSKPMGAQGEERAKQFCERFDSLEVNTHLNKDEPPPFHYGTHYSCAAYVLGYLMRLEPFSRLALSLQGGKFDVADRLFHDINSSWLSASQDNLQDVRELIPEFFYLPEFLLNSNMFDYGATQSGHVVDDVTLPAWAKGSTKRFIRINRQALESDIVSKNLHQWIDLIFGFKQRGREAVKAQNTFVHLTYEGSVDLETITDPVQREATIAQINNFGQTPSRLERRPFPQRSVYVVAKERTIDFNALQSLALMTPPFCIVGAPHRVHLNVTLWDTCRVGMKGQSDPSVGDMCLVKGQIVGVGYKCALNNPAKTYYRYGGANNGVSVHVAIPTSRGREVDRVVSIHDGMHRSPISALKPSRNGNWLVTGCTDSTVRVWRNHGQKLHLQATLCGHEGGEVSSVDLSTTFGTIATGGADGNVLVWDLRKLTYIRQLLHEEENVPEWDSSKVISVSINHKNGNILTLVASRLRMFDINGNLLAEQDRAHLFTAQDFPTCAVATDCPEWMDSGIVAVTGHKNGDVMLWSINNDTKLFEFRQMIQDKVHAAAITALRITGERQDTLLVGDISGKMSVCKTLRLDCLSPQELSVIMMELREGDSGDNGSESDRGWMYMGI